MFGLKLILLIVIFANESTGRKNNLLQSFNFDMILKSLKNVNSTAPCGLHIKEYIHGLVSKQSWAEQMRDSSAHTLHGVFSGKNRFLGHFDNCLSVKHPNDIFKGQHCLLNVDIYDEDHGAEIVQISKFKFESDSDYFSALFAICIPSTCSSKELGETLGKWFNETEEPGSIYVQLEEDNCYTEESIRTKQINWKILYCFISICIATVLSTTYDTVQRFYYRVDQPHHLLISFSVYTNSSYIFRNYHEDNQFKGLNGIRALFSIIMLIGHTYLNLLFGPAENMIEFKTELHQGIGNTSLHNITNTFFFLTGFLTAYMFFKRISGTGSFDFPILIINRYVRLTPSLFILKLFNGWIFLNLGSGPVWNAVNKEEYESCQDGWISFLLYCRNYIDPTNLCFFVGWFLFIDMQMFWLSPLILIPILYYPPWANIYFASLILTSICTSFAVSYSHGFQPQLKYMLKRWGSEYVLTHARLTPWLMGMCFGYILYNMDEGKKVIKFSKFKILLGWIVSILCLLIGLFGSYFVGDDASPVQGALIIALDKVFWTLGMAWIIFYCKEGFEGPINAFFSSGILQFLSKISFGIYLVHVPIISYVIGTRRINYMAGIWGSMYFIPIITFLSIVIAIPVTILITYPPIAINKCLLHNVKIWPIYKPVEKELKKEETKTE